MLLLCCVLFSLLGFSAYAIPITVTEDQDIEKGAVSSCDPAILVSAAERVKLLSKLRISIAGRQLLEDFKVRYGGLQRLIIQWDTVSYSQVTNPRGVPSRVPASIAASAPGTAVCVHLSKKLPEIENLADLAHEITHATRLELAVLRGDLDDVDKFVEARLAARGGEADAFAVECQVKRELLGRWDSWCSPYVDDAGKNVEVERVVDDLYSGRLSASLTGEAYPKMLAKQYRALLARKKVTYSSLENR